MGMCTSTHQHPLAKRSLSAPVSSVTGEKVPDDKNSPKVEEEVITAGNELLVVRGLPCLSPALHAFSLSLFLSYIYLYI